MFDDDGVFSQMRQSMSTSLPVSEQSRTRARRRFAVLGPLHGIVWGVAAYLSVPGYFDTFRVMATNSVLDWDIGDVAFGMVGGTMGMAGAIMLGSFLGFAAFWAAMKAYGTFRLGNRASSAYSMTGIAIGLTAALVTGLWTAPVQVGAEAAGDFGAEQAWGVWGWVMYYLPVALPALFLLIGLGNAVGFLVANRRSTQTQQTANHVRATGRHTPGQITKVRFTNTWLMGQPQFEIEVAFFGMTGPCRISQLVVTDPTQAPQVGGQVDVWYDPMHPETVIIEVGPAASPGPIDPRLFTSF